MKRVIIPVIFLILASPGFCLAAGWLFPSSASGDAWANRNLAFDSNLATASTTYQDGEYLVFNFSPLVSPATNCRVFCYNTADEGEGPFVAVLDADIDLYYSDAWHNLYSGEIGTIETIVGEEYTEIAITTTKTIIRARVKANTSLHYTGASDYSRADFCEFALYGTPLTHSVWQQLTQAVLAFAVLGFFGVIMADARTKLKAHQVAHGIMAVIVGFAFLGISLALLLTYARGV